MDFMRGYIGGGAKRENCVASLGYGDKICIKGSAISKNGSKIWKGLGTPPQQLCFILFTFLLMIDHRPNVKRLVVCMYRVSRHLADLAFIAIWVES